MSNFFKAHHKFLIIATLFLFLRLVGLGNDITNSDAIRWHKRSENFLSAVKTADLSSTYQHYQPGITLMWSNALVKQVAFSYQLTKTETPMTLENADWFPIIHGISKGVIVFILFALFVLQYFFVSQLFDKNTALFFTILITLEPYLIGIDRWFHLTSLETYFTFTSFLALLFWHKVGSKKVLALSAVLFSFGVYSKLTALIVCPILLFLLIKKTLKKKNAKSLLTFSLICAITMVILLPALWVSPLVVLTKLYNAVTNAVSGDIRAIYITGWKNTFFYLVILMFKLSPLAFLLFSVTLVKLRNVLKIKYALYILSYFLVFFITLTLSDQKIDRYAISLFPSILLLISLSATFFSNTLRTLLLVLLVSIFVFIFIQFNPSFSAYYSFLFGGTKNALQLGFYENSGEYFSNAARLLNAKGRDRLILIPNNIDSFAYYYKGNITTNFTENVDFVVSSLDFDRKVPESFGCVEISNFGSGNSPVVYVFECKK